MPYLGNTPSTSFATVVKDTFNGGSTAYTLSKVATTNSVSVFVENVRQEPTSAYSVSGTTLTFTATTPSGTGNIYVLHMNPTTTTTHPAAQNLTAVNGTLTGTLGVTGATTTAAITASGIIKTDDTTDATSTTDGSLQTDGGLSVAKDVVIGDDLSLKSDSAALNFGADNDVTLTHLADKGLILDVGDQTTSNFGTANTSADNLVVGGTGAVGMSLLTDANNVARICFGDVDDTDRGQISYNNSTHDLSIMANGEAYIAFGQKDAIKISMSNFATFTLADDASVTITSGTPAGAMLVLLTVHSTGYANLFFVSWIGSEFNLTGDTNFAVSDTDGKMACVFSSGSQYQFTLKNTRGGDTVYTVGVLAA